MVKPSLYLNCVPWAVLALLRALCKFPPATPRATRARCSDLRRFASVVVASFDDLDSASVMRALVMMERRLLFTTRLPTRLTCCGAAEGVFVLAG